jgi:hypothetical protein
MYNLVKLVKHPNAERQQPQLNQLLLPHFCAISVL